MPKVWEESLVATWKRGIEIRTFEDRTWTMEFAEPIFAEQREKLLWKKQVKKELQIYSSKDILFYHGGLLDRPPFFYRKICYDERISAKNI